MLKKSGNNTIYIQFTRSKNFLHRNPEDAPVYTEHSLFNKTKLIKLLFIVQSLLHHNPPYIWIKIILIPIQIECLHGTKLLNPDCDGDCDLDNLAPCKRDITYSGVDTVIIVSFYHPIFLYCCPAILIMFFCSFLTIIWQRQTDSISILLKINYK